MSDISSLNRISQELVNFSYNNTKNRVKNNQAAIDLLNTFNSKIKEIHDHPKSFKTTLEFWEFVRHGFITFCNLNKIKIDSQWKKDSLVIVEERSKADGAICKFNNILKKDISACSLEEILYLRDWLLLLQLEKSAIHFSQLILNCYSIEANLLIKALSINLLKIENLDNDYQNETWNSVRVFDEQKNSSNFEDYFVYFDKNDLCDINNSDANEAYLEYLLNPKPAPYFIEKSLENDLLMVLSQIWIDHKNILLNNFKKDYVNEHPLAVLREDIYFTQIYDTVFPILTHKTESAPEQDSVKDLLKPLCELKKAYEQPNKRFQENLVKKQDQFSKAYEKIFKYILLNPNNHDTLKNFEHYQVSTPDEFNKTYRLEDYLPEKTLKYYAMVKNFKDFISKIKVSWIECLTNKKEKRTNANYLISSSFFKEENFPFNLSDYVKFWYADPKKAFNKHKNHLLLSEVYGELACKRDHTFAKALFYIAALYGHKEKLIVRDADGKEKVVEALGLYIHSDFDNMNKTEAGFVYLLIDHKGVCYHSSSYMNRNLPQEMRNYRNTAWEHLRKWEFLKSFSNNNHSKSNKNIDEIINVHNIDEIFDVEAIQNLTFEDGSKILGFDPVSIIVQDPKWKVVHRAIIIDYKSPNPEHLKRKKTPISTVN